MDNKNIQIDKEYAQRNTLAEFNANNEINVKMLDITCSFAQSAIKLVTIINGGAALSIMTFIGNAWKTGIDSAIMGIFINAMLKFSTGVLTGAICAALAYITQFLYTNDHEKCGKAINLCCIITMIISYYLFYSGINIAADAFINLSKQ